MSKIQYISVQAPDHERHDATSRDHASPRIYQYRWNTINICTTDDSALILILIIILSFFRSLPREDGESKKIDHAWAIKINTEYYFKGTQSHPLISVAAVA